MTHGDAGAGLVPSVNSTWMETVASWLSAILLLAGLSTVLTLLFTLELILRT